MPTHQDVRLAQEAVKCGFVTDEQAAECLKTLKDAEAHGAGTKLTDVFRDKKYLTSDQCAQILTALGDQVAQKKTTSQLGSFKLIGKIGQGGMGVVYRGLQMTTNRTVAIKVLPPRLAADREFVERFYREGTAVCKLNHVNIVQGIEVGMAEGFHFFAMEFVDGESVQSALKRDGPMKEARTLHVVIQVARALQHAHVFGMVHRDIKPDNILLAKDDIAKLADLGLAKESVDVSLTLTGMALGTPYYMSPEQARGERDVDIRSDIYSLGATLYHMVTGEPPFQGSSALAIITKHLTEQLPSPQEKNPDLTDGICHVIEKMLAKDAKDRYQTPEQLQTDLELVIDGKSPSTARLEAAKTSVRQRAVRGTKATAKGGVSLREQREARRAEKAGKKLGLKPVLLIAVPVVVISESAAVK